MNAARPSMGPFRRSLRQTVIFVYRHSASLVVVSVCWFVSSLPIITSGLATLGAYSAIRSMRNSDRIEIREILQALQRHGFNAVLMGIVPVIVCVFTVLYFYRYTVTGSIPYVILSIVGVYLLSFLSFVLLTTFARLVDGCAFSEAVKDSYMWLVHNPLLSTMTVVASGTILLLGVVSVVGLVIIVPAVLFSFHMEVIQNSLTPIAQDGDR